MTSRKYSTEAIVLARRDYGEADRIITFFTKNYGKITLRARGVRRPKSRKRGHLEIFSQVKLQASQSGGFDNLDEVEEIENFNGIRTDLSKVTVAYYFIEVVNKITQEGEGTPGVYNLLLTNLELLKSQKKLKTMRQNFSQILLKLLGYWPYNSELSDPDSKIQEIIEKKLSSIRVGKKVLN